MEPGSIIEEKAAEIRTPAPKKSKAGITGVLFLLLAGAAMAWAYTLLGDGLTSMLWPKTKCMVLTSYSIEGDKTEGKVGFIPMVNYSYDVNGKQFTNVVVHIPRKYYKTKEEASAVSSKYKVDSEYQVTYNPSDPAVSLLEPAIQDPIAQACVAAAAVCVLAAIVSFVMAAMKR